MSVSTPRLSMNRLSAVAQIAVNKPQVADSELSLDLLFSLKQVRRIFRNLDELAESIRLNGIIEPLVVHEEADGRYRIIVGERRFRAASIAGLTKVPVIIKRGMSDLQIRRIQIAENNDRDGLTPFEEAMGVIEDVEHFGTDEAMVIWNRSASWISKRVAVGRYAPAVKSLLEDEFCGDFEILHCLNQIYNQEPAHTLFSRLNAEFRDGKPLTREEARNALAQLKATPKNDVSAPVPSVAQGSAVKPAPDTVPQPLPPAPLPDEDSLIPPLSAVTEKQQQAQLHELAHQDMHTIWRSLVQDGDVRMAQMMQLRHHSVTLGHDVQQTDWLLWQGFLAALLPVLEGLGSNRAALYLSKAATELADVQKPSMDLPSKPDGWHV
jgi:ParB family transcriptional regulator, chromosome partitioning protein